MEENSNLNLLVNSPLLFSPFLQYSFSGEGDSNIYITTDDGRFLTTDDGRYIIKG